MTEITKLDHRDLFLGRQRQQNTLGQIPTKFISANKIQAPIMITKAIVKFKN